MCQHFDFYPAKIATISDTCKYFNEFKEINYGNDFAGSKSDHLRGGAEKGGKQKKVNGFNFSLFFLFGIKRKVSYLCGHNQQ